MKFGIISVVLLQIALFIASAYGYIHNIYTLVSYTGEWGALQIVRAIGVVAFPLGVVMGFV